ncbi:hypothetical protein F5Y11DRAFT_280283 [Daldinia sp. FL1419]|nr:hypothetical protein F5Y11DRAFT_280283 [Daldinia sp. FL1419]
MDCVPQYHENVQRSKGGKRKKKEKKDLPLPAPGDACVMETTPTPCADPAVFYSECGRACMVHYGTERKTARACMRASCQGADLLTAVFVADWLASLAISPSILLFLSLVINSFFFVFLSQVNKKRGRPMATLVVRHPCLFLYVYIPRHLKATSQTIGKGASRRPDPQYSLLDRSMSTTTGTATATSDGTRVGPRATSRGSSIYKNRSFQPPSTHATTMSRLVVS